MTAPTYKKINEAIRCYGVAIFKGKGYHYFYDLECSEQFHADKIPSVYDGGFLRSMSLEDWISHVKSHIEGKI